MAEKKYIVALKWVSILPWAMFVCFIVHLISKFLTIVEHYWWEDGSDDSLIYLFTIYIQEPIVGGAASMAAFVIAGSAIAPKYNREVGLVLMILALCITFVSIFIANVIQHKYMSNVGLVASIVGSILGYIYVLENNKTQHEKLV